MKGKGKLPKRAVAYINEMGVRALDHLAAQFEPAGDAAAPDAAETAGEGPEVQGASFAAQPDEVSDAPAPAADTSTEQGGVMHAVTAPAQRALSSLAAQWRAMNADEKRQYVEKVAESVVEVVAASAILPAGARLGKKAAKGVGKAIRKRARKLRKASRRGAGDIGRADNED